MEKEVVAAEQEGDYPEVRFTNLKDGAQLPAKTELRVEVDTTDGDGIREVKLYLNGLFLKAHAMKPQVWSGKSDELLKALKPGMYHLEVVAEDKTGFRSHQEIQIAVGNVSQKSAANWRDEIHQVILNEGERLMD
ncbi:MAG: Ig-like domain-containing protein, partial [Planctomycetota bacterium]